MYGESRNMNYYGDGSIANKTQNIELTAVWLRWLRSETIFRFVLKGKDLNNGVGGLKCDHDLVKYIFGSFYKFNKNMTAVYWLQNQPVR